MELVVWVEVVSEFDVQEFEMAMAAENELGRSEVHSMTGAAGREQEMALSQKALSVGWKLPRDLG